MAEGKLEEAVTDCRTLVAEYRANGAYALDLAAVLRLLAKVKQPIAFEVSPWRLWRHIGSAYN